MRTILGSMTKKQKDYFTKKNYFKIEGVSRPQDRIGIINIIVEDHNITLSEKNYNELIKIVRSLYSNPLFLTLNVMDEILLDIVGFDDIKKDINYKNLHNYINDMFIASKILINGAIECCNYRTAEELRCKLKMNIEILYMYIIIFRNRGNTFSKIENHFLEKVLIYIEEFDRETIRLIKNIKK